MNWTRIVVRIIYWVMVLVVSVLLVLALVLLFESLDDSSVDENARNNRPPAGLLRH